MSTGRPLILGFIGQNACGVLGHASRHMNRLFERHGFDTAVVDLLGPHVPSSLHEATGGRPLAFAYGYAGIGARLMMGERLLWDVAQTPFLSLLADHPCYIPHNHAIDSRWVVNCYWTRDLLEAQVKHVRSPQMSFTWKNLVFWPFEADASVPRRDRPVGALYLKSGKDPATQERNWQALPQRMRDIILDSVAEAERTTDPMPADIVAARIEADGWHLGSARDYFWYLVAQVDEYVRSRRSTAIAQLLLERPDAVICGDGWDHLDRSKAKARLMPPIPASEMDALFASARTIVNTTPLLRDGPHERVLRAGFAGARIVSDEIAWSRRHLAGSPGFAGFEWTDPDRMERARAALDAAAADAGDDAARATGRHIASLCDNDGWADETLDIVRIVRLGASQPDQRPG